MQVDTCWHGADSISLQTSAASFIVDVDTIVLICSMVYYRCIGRKSTPPVLLPILSWQQKSKSFLSTRTEVMSSKYSR